MQELDPEEKGAATKPGYYTSTRRKVADFLIGFIAYPILAKIIQFDFVGFPRPFGEEYAAVYISSMFFALILVAVVLILSYIFSRKYIALVLCLFF
jgi:uncharacterized membrane protein